MSLGVWEIIKDGFMQGYMGKEKWEKLKVLQNIGKEANEDKLRIIQLRKDKNIYPDWYMEKSLNVSGLRELINNKDNFILTLSKNNTGVLSIKEIFKNYNDAQKRIIKKIKKDKNIITKDNYFFETPGISSKESSVDLPAISIFVKGKMIETTSLENFKKI